MPTSPRVGHRNASRVIAIVFVALVTIPVARLSGQEAGRTRGPSDAPLELTVYSDFECPYCRNFALAALPAIFAEFVDQGRLRVRYVFLPLVTLHKNAVATARAAFCAAQRGRFWAYHDYLFVRQPEWAGEPAPDSLWVSYAANLGIEPEPFAACLRDPETHAAVEADLRAALTAGATGTPTIVIAGRSLSGFTSYEELRREILASIETAQR